MSIASHQGASVATPVASHKAVDTAGLKEKISIKNLEFFYGDARALKSITLSLVRQQDGPPSSARRGLRQVHPAAHPERRMYDLYPGQRATGQVLFDGENLLDARVDINLLRARIGMVFQKPTPFPMSIYENVAFGLRLYEEKLPRAEIDARVEHALRRAGPVGRGQGQAQHERSRPVGRPAAARLCISPAPWRVKPEVILLDEPCSALDPISTAKIEELIDELKQDYTIVIVTHNMQQAARRVRLHGLHVSRRADRVRPDRDLVHDL